MKIWSLLLLCFYACFFGYAQEGHQTPIRGVAEAGKPSVSDWQHDLRFLQQTVHKDYPFLFKNVTEKQFDAEVDKLYGEMPQLQDHEKLAGLARIVALIKYGHTDISWRESPVKYHLAPLNFYWFSDGVYVEGASAEYPQAVGAKLLQVEGVPAANALLALKQLVPAENDQYYKAYGLDFLVIPEALHAQKVKKELNNTINYTFEKNGKIFNLPVKAMDAFHLPRNYGFANTAKGWLTVRDTAQTPYYIKHLDKIYYYEYLRENKTLYVRHSQIMDDPSENIPAFYKKVLDFIEKNDVEKLVIDVRLNGGGNNYKNKPIITGIIESKKINQPGKLFVIIGRRTFSACQNLVNEISNYTNAIFVGEPTAENVNFYGDNRRVVLPKTKTPVYLSFAWWQDKPQWENAPWLAPQLAADMSMNEYRTNRDPSLEACLQYSSDNSFADPVKHLQELFMAGKKDQLESEAKKMVADPRYRYISFEDKLNQSGYNLMNAGQMENAGYVFELNTKLYPNSANAWDSLAECCWKSKEKEKAIECYNKALSLDANGVTGDNARKMLKQIQEGIDH
jgi:tetratricopeptide (TPR) repeat protein